MGVVSPFTHEVNYFCSHVACTQAAQRLTHEIEQRAIAQGLLCGFQGYWGTLCKDLALENGRCEQHKALTCSWPGCERLATRRRCVSCEKVTCDLPEHKQCPDHPF